MNMSSSHVLQDVTEGIVRHFFLIVAIILIISCLFVFVVCPLEGMPSGLVTRTEPGINSVLRERINGLEEQVKNIKEQLVDVKAERDRLIERGKELKDELKEAKERMKLREQELKDEVKELKEKIANGGCENDEENEGLKRQLDEVNKEKEELKRECHKLKTEMEGTEKGTSIEKDAVYYSALDVIRSKTKSTRNDVEAVFKSGNVSWSL